MAEGKRNAIRRICQLSKGQMRGLDDIKLATLVEGLPWLNIVPIDQPIQKQLYYRGIRYRMPAAKFEDGTAFTFALADDFFNAYMEGDEEALLHLFATLARPLRCGQRKPLISRDEALRRSRWLKRIDPTWLAATWMYWAGVKAFVHSTYGSWLFQQTEQEEEDEEETSPQGPDTGASAGPDFGWWGKYMEVAETGVFGNVKQVHQTNFHDICVFLVKKEADHRRQKADMDAAKNRQP